MKEKLFIGLTVLVACAMQVDAYPVTREYLLGDMDDFVYDGLGSVDDVYVDPDWLAYVESLGSPENGIHGFDRLVGNHRLPFTFLFNLEGHEQVVAGTLTVALRTTASQTDTDGITFDGLGRWLHFVELGWLPITDTDMDLRSIDFVDTLGDDLLYLLQNGYLNVLVEDDVAISYAVLSVQVTPEPGTVSLLTFGALAVIGRRRNKRALT